MPPEETPDPEIEFLIAQVSGNPVAMLTLARTLLLPRGMSARARSLCDTAEQLAPRDPEVRALAQAIRSKNGGEWYFTMVQDEGRHGRYAEAFRQAIAPGDTVLDIGAGTSLFAMLAAREGAAQVIACERSPDVAAAAAATVAKNGLSDKIRVIAKDSRELEIGNDLDARADVLIWDNLSNDLVSAGAFETIRDARARLLKPGAPVIPARCEVRVALVEAAPAADYRMGVVEGFDLTPFNRLAPTQVTMSRSKCERKSDSATIFDFRFAEAETLKPQRARAIVAANGGRVDGIVQWLRFSLTDRVVYDTFDAEGVTAFGLQYHAIDPFEAEPGQEVAIYGAHDGQRMWFWTDEPPMEH